MAETKRLKLPVFRTVGRTYGFLFKRFFEILRVSWFGIVGMAVVIVGMFAMIMGVGGDLREGAPIVAMSPAEMLEEPLFYIFLLAYIPMFVFIVMVSVGVTKVYFDLPRGSGAFYFKLDGAFWRVLAAYILYFLFYITLDSALSGGMVALLGLASAQGGSDPQNIFQQFSTPIGIVFIIGAMILYFLFLFISLRISLLVPAAVTDGGLGFSRSWRFMKGNVWRLIGAYLVMIILFYVLMAALIIGLASAATAIGAFAQWGEPPGTRSVLVMMIPVFFLFYSVFFGVLIGLGSAAYKALRPNENATLVDGEVQVAA